jgi:hypothetical protein
LRGFGFGWKLIEWEDERRMVTADVEGERRVIQREEDTRREKEELERTKYNLGAQLICLSNSVWIVPG